MTETEETVMLFSTVFWFYKDFNWETSTIIKHFERKQTFSIFTRNLLLKNTLN